MLVRFFIRDSGAVTIDWTVVAAAMMALGLLTGSFIKSGLSGFGDATAMTIGGVHVLGADDTLISFEDFEHGAAGWVMGRIDDTDTRFGGILGRFGGTGGAEAVRKTFRLNPERSHVFVEFDIHAIDDWALDDLIVYVNGQPALTRSFSTRPDMVSRQRTELADLRGIRVAVTPSFTTTSNRGFGAAGAADQDQTLRLRLVVDNPGASLSIGFGATLPDGTDRASWAVDNLRVISTDSPPA